MSHSKAMTNKGFYAFCRDQRKVEPDANKKAALADVYGYMWDCGVTKRGVAWYITHRIAEQQDEDLRAAYRWLLDMFQPGSMADSGQESQLFSDQ